VPPFAITVLKVAFLGLLYLFIFHAFRSVVVDIRPASPKPAPRAPRAARPSGGPPPTKVGVLDESGSEVATVPLEGQVQIGRADACQIKSTDTFVSAFHARLFRKDGAWFVEDMGSTNGTFLNKERVTAPTEVRTGDRVMVGRTTLELRA
jgi:pSer/pThr/pTyr-binding forkhead associated (FHA) protein